MEAISKPVLHQNLLALLYSIICDTKYKPSVMSLFIFQHLYYWTTEYHLLKSILSKILKLYNFILNVIFIDQTRTHITPVTLTEEFILE